MKKITWKRDPEIALKPVSFPSGSPGQPVRPDCIFPRVCKHTFRWHLFRACSGPAGLEGRLVFRFIPICAVLCSYQREVNITMSASHKWHFYFFVCSDRASCGCGGVSPYAGCEVDGLILWKVLQTLFTFFLSFFHWALTQTNPYFHTTLGLTCPVFFSLLPPIFQSRGTDSCMWAVFPSSSSSSSINLIPHRTLLRWVCLCLAFLWEAHTKRGW